jgi:predicted ArsR family transcriptional regulator
MASDMSHRHLTITQLANVTGLKRMEVRHFVEMLEAKGVLLERECMTPQFWSLSPFGGWLRRAISGAAGGR